MNTRRHTAPGALLAATVALCAAAWADGLRSEGNADAVLTWEIGSLEPGQSRRQAVVFAFAASLDELRATAQAARDHLRRLGQPPQPSAKPKPLVWLRNGVTNFAVEANGAFFWEKWRRQTLGCPDGGQLSRLGYYLHYRAGEGRRAGTPINPLGAKPEALQVVQPARPCGPRQAVATVQTADGLLRVRIRAALGRGQFAAWEFLITNIGDGTVQDVTLAAYANLEARHTHSDDLCVLDRQLGGALFFDPSGYVVGMLGLEPPSRGYCGRWPSQRQLAAATGQPLARWESLEKAPRGLLALRRRLAQPYPPAPPVPAREPPTRTLGPQEAEAILEADWLFQAEGKPLAARAAQEIQWAEELAARLRRYEGCPDLGRELAELRGLKDKLQSLKPSDQAAAKNLYLAVRRVKRRVMFKNPAIDFDSVLFIDQPYPQGHEWRHQARHRNGMMAVPGGRLLLLEGLHPGGTLRKVAPMPPGAYWRPDLSFDAKRVLFCFKPHDDEAFHLYEVNLDGTGLRQLTRGPYDDTDPIYLPDGRIMFTTTRCHTYVRCMPYTYSYVLAICNADGSDIRIISRSNEPDWCPALMEDGRVIYSRWEYTDKALWRIQSLWTTNPDGSGTAHFYGNQSVWPDHLTEARQIPGSPRVIFTGLAHHDWFAGCIGILDTRKGRDYPNGLTKVTWELPWPESRDGPEERPERSDYHTAGRLDAYKSPYPLSEEDFLVSARRGGKFRLYLMDVYGNRELIYEGAHNVWHALPVKPRPRPRPRPQVVKWPSQPQPTTGVFYSPNVYQGVPDLPKGIVKYLRVIQDDYKTYTLWRRDFRFEGPAVSIIQADSVKRILGTVPVEPDGSVHFEAPAGVAIHFQLLDANYRAVHTMRTFTGIQPGERRGCVGCHEQTAATPPNFAAIALTRPASRLQPPPWGAKSISYERMVQPILERYCGKCHTGEGKGRAKLDLTLRPGVAMFKEPYVTLVRRGIANAIMAENYNQRDPRAYVTFRPMRHLSCKSKLIERAMKQKVDPLSLRILIGWVDTNCPYRGEDDIRSLPEPRCAKAPVVQRILDQLTHGVPPIR